MAINEIAWDSIAPGATSSWFIHGYTHDEWVGFSIVTFGGIGPVFNSVGHATLTQGESTEHVDGTKAYIIYIKNNSSTTNTDVRILENKQAV